MLILPPVPEVAILTEEGGECRGLTALATSSTFAGATVTAGAIAPAAEQFSTTSGSSSTSGTSCAAIATIAFSAISATATGAAIAPIRGVECFP